MVTYNKTDKKINDFEILDIPDLEYYGIIILLKPKDN